MDCKQPGEGLKLQNRRVPCQRKAWIDVGQWAEYRKALKVIEGISS